MLFLFKRLLSNILGFFFTTFFVIRAKIKAEKEAEALLSSGPGEPRITHSKQHKDENAVTAQRAKWREWKSKEHGLLNVGDATEKGTCMPTMLGKHQKKVQK